jgi:predicted PurR-regulated permease PerM
MTSAIKLISKVICLVLVLSFVMFVVDELTVASANQTAVAGEHATTTVTRDAHGREINPNQTKMRKELDQINDTLTKPAEKLVTSTSGTTSPWVQRGVPFILGLLFFGLLLHMLANWFELSRSGGSSTDPQAGFTAGYR